MEVVFLILIAALCGGVLGYNIGRRKRKPVAYKRTASESRMAASLIGLKRK